jgi:hypothetical protein
VDLLQAASLVPKQRRGWRKKWMLCLIGALCIVTQAAAQQTPDQQRVPPPPGEIPQIVAYDKEGLLGTTSISLAIRPIWASGTIVSPRWSFWWGTGNFLMRRTVRARR